jgi:anti-anti-sigma factor
MVLREASATRQSSRQGPASATAIGPARFRVAEAGDGGERCLRLHGELDIAAVHALREHVRRAAVRDGVAILDLSEVEFIDVAGLSMLSALVREARSDGWSLELRRASLAVRQLARLTSMQDLWQAA